MRSGYEVFLAVARELSVSKAAQQLHITQQCASDHIRRLEKEYDVTLFERKPQFRLTMAGEIMLHSLQNIQILESNMKRSLTGIEEGTRGSFTLGISTSRAPIILPRVLPQYYHAFPDVNISFIEEDTQLLEERLLAGQIDLFIGINTTPHPDYEITTIASEGIYLVISDYLLSRNFSPKEIENMEQGIDLNHFSHVPFTLSFRTGKVNHAIAEYLNTNNVRLNVTYNISDTKTQIQLCRTGICAALCPKMLLDTPYMNNQSHRKQEKLHAFPINHFGQNIHIDLVSHKNVPHPLFIQKFIQLLQDEIPQITRTDSLDSLGWYESVKTKDADVF